jgi:hypothetical protein
MQHNSWLSATEPTAPGQLARSRTTQTDDREARVYPQHEITKQPQDRTDWCKYSWFQLRVQPGRRKDMHLQNS